MSGNSGIKIHALRCGYIAVPKDTVSGRSFYSPASRALTPMRERVELPVFCFLVEHPKGRVLIDTGLSRDISPDGEYSGKDAARVLTAPLAAFYHPCVPMGASIDEQLSALSLRPSDLDHVLLTHLDADHVCGLRHLSGAKHILCSQEDYWWSCRTVYRSRQPRSLWLTEGLDMFWYKGTDIGPTRWSYDFFGDGSFVLIHLPGHTEGQFGALLRGGSGRFALITADAAYNSTSWQSLEVPGYVFNREAALKSLQWIREKSLDPSCAAVLASHDAALSPRVIEL